MIKEAYEALGNSKGDITCISDIKYLKAEGFGTNGRPIVDCPNKWDRIGAISGENFTTLPSEGKIFSFDDRADRKSVV